MNISQRLRTCAKHTALDAVIELLNDAADEHDAVIAERDALRADAKRYRWLRDRDLWPAPFASSQDPEPVRGTDLDAAIDAAMIAFHAQKGGE